MSTSETAPRWRDLVAGANRPVAVIIGVAVALHSANIYVATAVMPSVVTDVGGRSLYAWATTVFVFAAVLGSTACATLIARRGARSLYAGSVGLVTLGTVLCAIAPSMGVVLAGRLVQGLGGGLLFALAYTLVHLMLPRALWGRAMSLISAMWGVGTFAGPALGGTLAQIGAWRLAFWVVVPVTVAFTFWGSAQLSRSAGRREDPPRAPLASVGLLGTGVLVLSAAGLSHRPLVNATGLAAATMVLIAWLRLERSGKQPRLLPASTFASAGGLRWTYATMVLLMLAATPEVFVAYFGQMLQGLGPLAAGYLATALAAGWTTASMVLGGADRDHLIMRASPLVCAAGLVVLAVTGASGPGAAVLVTIAIAFFVLGWGVGMAWPHLVTSVLSRVPDEEQDLAGASVTTVQLTAAAAGAAIAGTIVNLAGFADPGGVEGAQSAAQALYVAMTVAPLLAIVTVHLALRRRRASHPAGAFASMT